MDKELPMVSAQNTISEALLEATSDLAENLMQSEPFLRFKETERKLQANHEAMQLLAEFAELQQKIQSQRNSATVNEHVFTRFRELQSIIGMNDVIQEHDYAKESAIIFLRDVNREITNNLGIDFASLTRRSSGCC